jgi:reactive chlorine resistance protein C
MTTVTSDEFTRLRGKTSGSITIFCTMANAGHIGMVVLRTGLVIVLLWIGGLKFADYEADSIVPFVSNSPALEFLYSHNAPEYRHHMNKEGELIAENRAWHQENRTYIVSHALGLTIIALGLAIALHSPFPEIAAVGSCLLIGMCFVTLSFLVTTPEVWVPALGDSAHGFPYLSGAGRLVIKDCIMLGAAMVTMSDSAKAYLRRISSSGLGPLNDCKFTQ